MVKGKTKIINTTGEDVAENAEISLK